MYFFSLKQMCEHTCIQTDAHAQWQQHLLKLMATLSLKSKFTYITSVWYVMKSIDPTPSLMQITPAGGLVTKLMAEELYVPVLTNAPPQTHQLTK